jgi:DNA repair exonuclease SbcCD ATPase subunit
MGIFDWFGSIFSRKEQTEVIVPFRDLGHWINENTGTLVDSNNTALKERYEAVASKKAEAFQLLSALREAKLQNPNIEPRMLHFMSGNRDNYIQQVEIFLNNFPEFSQDFYSKLQESLDNLAKKTGRSYQILQEFFANESKAIAMKIKELENLSKEIHELRTGGKIRIINEIKERIDEIKQLQSSKDAVFSKIESDESKLNQCREKMDELKKQADEIRNSSRFADHNQLTAEREKLSVKLKMLDSDVNQEFSALKRAFKKFRRITLSHEYETLIDSYLNSPLIGLIDDLNLDILELFKEIKSKINSLVLDDKEQSRLRQKLKEITREKLEGYVKLYNEMKQQLVVIKEKLQQNTVLQDIDKFEQEIELLDRAAKRKEIELAEENKKLESISFDEKIKQLQLLVNQNFGTNICIK